MAVIETKEEALKRVKEKGEALYLCSKELRNDKEVVLAAVENFGFALTFASDELKDEKSVVFAAINNTPTALKHASERLKTDDETISFAVNTYYDDFVIEFCKEGLRSTKVADIRYAFAYFLRDQILVEHIGAMLNLETEVVRKAVIDRVKNYEKTRGFKKLKSLINQLKQSINSKKKKKSNTSDNLNIETPKNPKNDKDFTG